MLRPRVGGQYAYLREAYHPLFGFLYGWTLLLVIQTGGMVVKNVAGLDMGKMMIGSFGTLAAIASVNFRVHALPDATQTFLYASSDPDFIMDKHHRVVRETQLRPTSIDILSPPAAARVDAKGFVLAIRAAGSRKVLDRYERELSDAQTVKGEEETAWWKCVTEFPADFLRRHGLVPA